LVKRSSGQTRQSEARFLSTTTENVKRLCSRTSDASNPTAGLTIPNAATSPNHTYHAVWTGISWLLIRSETWASVTTVTAPARKSPRPPRPKRRKSRPRGVQDAAYCWSEEGGSLMVITSVASEEPSSRYHCEYSLHSSCCAPSTSKPMHPNTTNACHALPAVRPRIR